MYQHELQDEYYALKVGDDVYVVDKSGYAEQWIVDVVTRRTAKQVEVKSGRRFWCVPKTNPSTSLWNPGGDDLYSVGEVTRSRYGRQVLYPICEQTTELYDDWRTGLDEQIRRGELLSCLRRTTRRLSGWPTEHLEKLNEFLADLRPTDEK